MMHFEIRGLFLSLALGTLLTSCASVDRAAASREFDWTVGTWVGVRRDVADGSETPMRMRVEPLLGGGGQLRTLEVGGAGATPYRGTAVQQYDAVSGRWLWQYTNSAARPFAQYEGEVAPAAGGAVSTWRSVRPGRTRESRLVSERLIDGYWRRSMEVSTDGGVTWIGLFVDVLRKVDDSAGAAR